MTVYKHQHKTAENLCELRDCAPDVEWLPVLQGWAPQQYIDHIRIYERYGINLSMEKLVGVGSVAARQLSPAIPEIFTRLNDAGLHLHGFGLSHIGLARVGHYLQSADSMVWSFVARRRRIKHPQCRIPHLTCNNCRTFALAWRRNLLSQLNAAISLPHHNA